MAYSRYVKPEIICDRCGKQARPVREIYCRGCASTLVRYGTIPKIIGIETPLNLTQYQNQILTGLMLGDGCVYQHKKTYKPYLVVIRSQSDREYLWDNYKVFKEFCKSPPCDRSVFDKRTSNTTYYSKFQTRSCKVFESYRLNWYCNKKKIVPRNIELTPLTLAIWFCDDGYMRIKYKSSVCIQLSTDGFLYDDVVFLKEKMKTIYDIDTHISKNRRLMIYGIHGKAFCNIVDSYIPESMNRKKKW